MSDTCRPIEVDGTTVLVRGPVALTDEDRAALAEIVRAARERYGNRCCGHPAHLHDGHGCLGRVLRMDETGANRCRCTEPGGSDG